MLLVSESRKKTDQIIEQAEGLYGFTLEEKTAKNIEWMLQNGYLKKRKVKRDKRRRGR
jgi:hypothetical protein